MPAGFRRHLVDKTLINVFHSDTAEIRFVGELVVIQTFSQTMQRIECNSLIKQHDTSLPLNSTHDAMLCRQNGDRIVTDRRFCDLTSPSVQASPDSVVQGGPKKRTPALFLL